MRMYDLILKKRNNQVLSTQEIDYFIRGYMRQQIPDYQVAALLMAIYFQGLNSRETADLTLAMINSGQQINLDAIDGIKVDKHSTGGVGDKTTLVLVPLVASAGIPVAKMSGRSLGHTGGTVDKLETIPGFKVNLTPRQFIRQVQQIGVALAAPTGEVAPADKKLYALRDVTATVDNLSLIAASIVAKKIASGADAIVFDVKCGSGAFMSTPDQARALAQTMLDICGQLGRSAAAVVTDMNVPLGHAVGNALEVREAIATLQGQGPEDLRELCLVLGAQMLMLAGKTKHEGTAKETLEHLLTSGAAWAKFLELVEHQGGNLSVVEQPQLLPRANYVQQVRSPRAGYIATMNTLQLGLVAMELGAGRAIKDDVVDFAAGLVVHKKVGTYVQQGDVLAELHTNRSQVLQHCSELTVAAYNISRTQPARQPLVLAKLS